MRYFVNFVLLLALCACGWFLYDQSRQPTVDLVAETKLKVDVPELVLATIEARKNDENARISGTPIEADCFVWGPFDGRQLTSVQSTLKTAVYCTRLKFRIVFCRIDGSFIWALTATTLLFELLLSSSVSKATRMFARF